MTITGLLTACSGEDGGGGWSLPVLGPPDVDVDTPGLRAAKRSAGIDDCPATDDPPGESDLPALTLECFGGGPSVDLSRLRGPLVVSVWGAWCPPCREEMPHLAAFHDRFGEEVPILGIDVQDVQPDLVMSELEDSGATYPQLADPGGSIRGVGPFSGRLDVPFLVLLDDDGRVAHRQAVEIDSPDELRDLVEEHLGPLGTADAG
ncbi:TlpA family protein disulfide reductase [Nocardioides sp. CFH 31398]|nr:TlpA family protein disulfide reductase [Nocardioides sp. CFH 31398]